MLPTRVVVTPLGPSVPGHLCEGAKALGAASPGSLTWLFLLGAASMRQSIPCPPVPTVLPTPELPWAKQCPPQEPLDSMGSMPQSGAILGWIFFLGNRLEA